MADDLMGYQTLLERALKGVVRDAMSEAAANGLPGEHHFYVTFRTGAPGVEVGNALRAQYPDEMTIVLQHQFWDLDVGDDGFAVTLSFNQLSQRLVIPFDAVIAFLDPAVNFGLQFDAAQAANIDDETGDGTGDSPVLDAPVAKGEVGGQDNVVPLDTFRKK
jgi:hypothetical protein